MSLEWLFIRARRLVVLKLSLQHRHIRFGGVIASRPPHRDPLAQSGRFTDAIQQDERDAMPGSQFAKRLAVVAFLEGGVDQNGMPCIQQPVRQFI